MTEQFKNFLTGEASKPLMHQFAYLGTGVKREEYFKELAELSEAEIWTSPNSSNPNDILYSYIVNTFEKAARDDLITFSEDEKYACFNTGLLTENGEDILCLFNRYDTSDRFKFHITGFRKESDRQIMDVFSATPKVVQYFDNPDKIYFDPAKSVVKNLDHILDDNIDRFPQFLKEKGKPYILSLLTHALELTVKRCKRNYRIAVPQYYNGQITYLLPVNLDGHSMALAVEFINNRYRANTIFTIEMAYKNARLLMKPEADWLDLKAKEK